MTPVAKNAVLAVAVCAALACAECAQAQSRGVMHLPSTAGQYFGYGYGAGHHAPIVKTPAQRPPRMKRWMRAPGCSGPLGPASYSPGGCHGHVCSVGATGPAIAAAAPANPGILAPAAALLAPAAPIASNPELVLLPPVDDQGLTPLPPIETVELEPLPPAVTAWATLRGVRSVH